MRSLSTLGILRFLCGCTLVASSTSAHARQPIGEGLQDLSQRLRDGDRSAIAELLERTRPAGTELQDSNARIAALRAEIERLNARRGSRPVFPVTAVEPVTRANSAADHSSERRGDALRASRAWLRAGEPESALRALPTTKGANEDDALYLEARALEALGRDAEALELFRRLATSAESPTLRARAGGDVAHVAWRIQATNTREDRP